MAMVWYCLTYSILLGSQYSGLEHRLNGCHCKAYCFMLFLIVIPAAAAVSNQHSLYCVIPMVRYLLALHFKEEAALYLEA